MIVWAVGSLAAGLLAGAAGAQAKRNVRIGLLLNRQLAEGADALVAELDRLGYSERRNLVLDWRLVDTAEHNAALAAELVGLRPDLLIGAGTLQVEALRRVAGSIPIVFCNTADPVGQHLVASLARPGGNVTGIANLAAELAAKRLEMIERVDQGTRRVAVLFNPRNPVSEATLRDTEAAGTARRMTVIPAPVGSPEELPTALQRMVRENAGALIGAIDVMISAHNRSIIAFALEHRLLTMFSNLQDARAGGLMSYGIDPAEGYRRAADLVDKILGGAKPADLPVEQPDRLHLVINLRTATALGLTLPAALLAQADEVVE